MKKVIAFIPADKNNLPYAQMLVNSIRKWHSEEELPITIIDNPDPKDQAFWYRATPIIAKDLLKEYELALKLDADQICFGPLTEILNDTSYDVGTVLNINRMDPQTYGIISFQGIAPNEYYNNGLVAIRSKDFVDRWYDLCFSKYFDRLQFREQDILNILAHYGGYKVRCFDNYTPTSASWWGLVAKGESHRAILRGKDVVIPKGEDGYPDRDTVLKLWHCAGGSGEKKVNYRIHFSEKLIAYIDYLISNSNEKYIPK